MDERLFFPATTRNGKAILEILERILPKDGSILEIASGSGQHGVLFQKHLPHIKWQTSDPDPIYRKSISSWIKYKELSTKMPQPIALDVRQKSWALSNEMQLSLKAIVCINMLHITSFECTEALFEGAKKHLKTKHFLIIYGPFKREGQHTTTSNMRFDLSLKAQNPDWGIRDLEEVNDISTKNGFKKNNTIQMPANNLIVIFKKN